MPEQAAKVYYLGETFLSGYMRMSAIDWVRRISLLYMS